MRSYVLTARRPLAMVLLACLVATAMPGLSASPAGAADPPAFGEYQQLDVPDGQYPEASVIDPQGQYLYVGATTPPGTPGKVLKVRLADLTIVATLTLAAGESSPKSAAIDPSGTFAYFGTFTVPSKIVQIRLSDFTRVTNLSLADEVEITSLAVAPSGEYLYVVTYGKKVIKLRLSNFTQAGSTSLNTYDFRMPFSIDAAGAYAYTGGQNFLNRVQLDTMVPTSTAIPGGGAASAGFVGANDTYAYYAVSRGGSNGVVLKVRTSDFVIVDTLTFASDEGYLQTATRSPDGRYAYIGVGGDRAKLVKLDLSTFTRVATAELATTTGDPTSSTITLRGNAVYLTTFGTPTTVTKVATGEDLAPATPPAPLLDLAAGSIRVHATSASTGPTTDSFVARIMQSDQSCTMTVAEGSCELTGLDENGSYLVSVVARNAYGDSLPSAPSPSEDIPATPGAGSTTPQFPDVPAGVYYTRATSMLKLRGISTPSSFNPSGSVTRAQMAGFLYRLAGKPDGDEGAASCGFSDEATIPTYAQRGACWLRGVGITTNNPFRPNDVVTRAQMAGFLYRFAGKPDGEEGAASCGFSDETAIPTYAQRGACWLRRVGITTNNPYRPADVVTRAQMAAFLYRTGGLAGFWVVAT